jgi:hypothetical protein
MIRGMPSLARLALGPSGLQSILSYEHVRQLFVSTFVSSFRHEHISTVGRIYTRMQMQDSIDDFYLINYKQQMTTMGCMVDHIHLDKKYIQHTLPKMNNMPFVINYSF